ncbi:MAG: phage tail protein [Opitutales bacterium]
MPEYTDPYRAYNFKLLIQGVTEGHFTECTGLGLQVKMIKYREAGNNQVVHCVPSQVTYDEVTLRYGLTDSKDLWDWMLAIVKGLSERKNVSILMLDSEGANEVLRWDLINALPCAWSGAPLQALSHEVAIESLTLAFEQLERA